MTGTIFTFSLTDRKRVQTGRANAKHIWLTLSPADRADTEDEIGAVTDLLDSFAIFVNENIGRKTPAPAGGFAINDNMLLTAEGAIEHFGVILARVPLFKRGRLFRERRDQALNTLHGIVQLLKRLIAQQ